jgi:GT2 family glycosyltransferase
MKDREQAEASQRGLEPIFTGRPTAYYRRLRMYYRRWRRLLGLSSFLWRYREKRSYQKWIQEEAEFFQAVRAGRRSLADLVFHPRIAVFVIVREPDSPWLDQTISSVRAQWYPHWELWLCLGASGAFSSDLSASHWRQENRIKLSRSPESDDLAARLNEVLGQTSCEFFGLLEQGDELAPHALYEIAKQLQHDVFDYCYSDEDEIDASGRRSRPFCKPDWSPELCLSSLYACRFGVYRRVFAQEVGGFRPEFAACPDYDLLLRCASRSERIAHIPRLLYHRRMGRTAEHNAKGNAMQQAVTETHERAKAAVCDAVSQTGEVATVEDGPTPCTFHVRRQIRGEPLISIIIPTRDRLQLLRPCIESVEQRTTYRNYEILIVDNQSQEPRLLAYLASLRHRVIRYNEPFNFARLNNRAVAEAQGEYVLLLNNDMEVITSGWLAAMLAQAQRREVGAVGAQLLYADGTVQHAGVVLGFLNLAGHAHKYQLSAEPGYHCFPHLSRDYSAVTAACLLTRKAVYEELDGMDEHLAVNFNDVDFCLRLRERGYRIMYTPQARLYHHESHSRWRQPPPAKEAQYMRKRWGALLTHDPFYNPHLTLKREDFGFDRQRARAVLTT